LGRQRKQTREESMPVRSAQRSQRVLHSSQTRATLTGLEPWPQPRQTSGGLGGTKGRVISMEQLPMGPGRARFG
jgi:hypothetical protein